MNINNYAEYYLSRWRECQGVNITYPGGENARAGILPIYKRPGVNITYPGGEKAEVGLFEDDEVGIGTVGEAALTVLYPQGERGVEGGSL